MKFRKFNKVDKLYEYNEDIKILSPIQAYRCMLSLLSTIHLSDGDEPLGVMLCQMDFDAANNTSYARSWELWEKAVRQEIKKGPMPKGEIEEFSVWSVSDKDKGRGPKEDRYIK